MRREKIENHAKVEDYVSTDLTAGEASDPRMDSNLSHSQQLLWLGQQLNPKLPLYNMIHASTIYGTVDSELFVRAFQSVVDASDALRTTIKVIDGTPQQETAAVAGSALEVVDLSETPDPSTAYNKWQADRQEEVLDLEKCLYSSALVKLGEEKSVWYLCVHHLVADAQSFALIFSSTSERYALAKDKALASAKNLPDFSEYIRFERDFCRTPAWQKAVDYWQEQVTHSGPAKAIYGVNIAEADSRISRLTLELGAVRSASLRAIAERDGFASLSPSMSLSSIWATLIFVLLHRVTGERHLRVGTPFQARPTEAFKKTIGAFVEVGVLNAKISKQETFSGLYQQVLRRTIEGLRHVRPGISSAELNRSCTVRLNYVTAKFDKFVDMPVKTDWIHSGYGDSQQPIQFQVCDFDQTGKFIVYLDVNQGLFDDDRQRWLVDQTTAIIDGFLQDPDRLIGDFALLTARERQVLVNDFNDTNMPLAEPASIVPLITRQMQLNPDVVAATDGTRSWSYAELDLRANQIAAALDAIGVGMGSRVALCMDRSLDVLAAIWAVLRSGSAFCPLDPAYPSARKRELLEDLQPAAVIVASVADLGRQIPDGLAFIELDRIDLQQVAGSYEPPDIAGQDLAYLIYTSGSTGKPKAAMLSHEGLVNYACWAGQTYLQNEPLDFALYSSLSFDLTLTSIFVPLVLGARIRIYNEEPDAPGLEILSVFKDNAVDVVKLTPSHLELLVQQGFRCQRIRKLIVGGENFKTSTARAVIAGGAEFEIYNEYGPTEATVGCMVHRYNPHVDNRDSVPIGLPAANTHIYVRDQYNQPVPPGVVGEMIISGPGVALGYWNRDELTAAKFGIDPDTDSRLYRTGDLARWGHSGIEFLGRADDQVKVRGVRVELGELEARLLEHPDVETAVAIVHRSSDPDTAKGGMSGGAALAACYVSKAALSPGELKSYLQSKLPEFMVPTYLLHLDAMPLTRNGKIDRGALPDPVSYRAPAEINFVSPTTPLQKQLAEIWQDVLNIPTIGAEDNFFELGGDSVGCIQIAAKAQEAGIALTPRAIFQHPTVTRLADSLGEDSAIVCNDHDVTKSIALAGTADIDRIRSTLGETEFATLEEFYPLTPTQAGMLYHCLSSTHRGIYVGQVRSSLEGPLDIGSLRLAYEQLVGTHSVLRTRFFWQGLDEPLQSVVNRDQAPNWQLLDWSSKPVEEFAMEIDRLPERIRNNGFDLEAGPALRMTVVRESDTKVHLIWTTHHILFDGWSAYPLFNEWLTRYDGLLGQAVSLPAPRPFSDYVAWVNQQDKTRCNTFWADHLAGVGNGTLLPIGKTPAVESARREMHEVILSGRETAALEQLARKNQVTLNAVFQSAWGILLSRYCGQSDVVFGVTHSGRNAELTGIDRMIGLFINTLPVHLKVNSEAVLNDWLPQVQQALLDISEFEYSSLSDIQRTAGYYAEDPLFDSLVVFENYPSSVTHSLASVSLGPLSFTAPSHYPLAVLVYPDAEMKVHFIYDNARFDANEMSRLGGHLRCLLSAIANDAHCSIGSLPLLTETEEQALGEWSNADKAPLPDKSIQQLIDLAAQRDPNDIAVACGTSRLSYGKLEQLSNSLANALLETGVTRGNLVGVVAHRTSATVVAILATLKAGAAFVPIDPLYPCARTQEIIADANLHLVLVDGDFQTGDSKTQVLDVNSLWSRSCTGPAITTSPDDLAYVLYTSGSTGKPKGVMVSQRNIVHSTTARQRYYPDKVGAFLHLSSFAFDSAMAGLFWTLCDGGTLILPGDDHAHDVGFLLKQMAAHKATHLLALPSFYTALLEAAHRDEFNSLGVAIVAGEACPAGLYELHRETCSDTELFNEYGPTEATVWSHVYQFRQDFAESRVPIGSAIDNVTQFVLDGEQRPVPIGVPGELVLGGPGIASGYLGKDVQTREKFVRLPHLRDAGDTLFYKTGDIVSWRPDGSLDFLGRIDDQLKIRGHRIEPGEIESALLQHPAVIAVSVGTLAKEPADSAAALVAWYVADRGLADPDLVRQVEDLPSFMRPDKFIAIDEIPLLPNGKIDRRKLTNEYADFAPAVRPYRAPESTIEKRLCSVWQSILKIDKVGLDDNFFALGGESIAALRVAAQMHRHGYNLKLKDVVSTASLRALADTIGSQATEIDDSRQLQVGEASDRRFFPLSPAQSRLWFLALMESHAGLNNVYCAYRLQGVLDINRLATAFSKLARRHEILRTVFVTENDEPRQMVLPEVTPDWAAEVLPAGSDLELRLKALIANRFDLGTRPPWIARLIKVENDHILVLVFHHIIMDGESVPAMLRDLSGFYSGSENAVMQSHEVVQYGDYARWQHDRLASASHKAALDFWLSELSGTLPTLEFPSFSSRPSQQAFVGDVVSASISGKTAAHVKRYARQNGLSLYNLLLSSFSAVLLRYCNQTEVVVGTPVSESRSLVGAENSLGPYINTVAIRLQPDAGCSFAEFSKYVQEISTDAFDHSDVPFETVVAALDLPRDLSRTPVYQALFAFRRGNEDIWALPDVNATNECLTQSVARTDLSCWVVEEDDHIQINLEFCSALIEAGVARSFLNQWLQFLDASIADPHEAWSRLPLLDKTDSARLLRRCGPSAVDSIDHSVCDVVWAAANEHPDRIALSSDGVVISYADLHRRATACAANLADIGVGPGDFVGLAVSRSERLPLAILGILQAGAAYVPLDMTMPGERLQHIANDSGLKFIVNDAAMETLPFAFKGTLLALHDLDDGIAVLDEDELSAPRSNALAYLIYTSGSTGLPKGVEIGHRQVVNFLGAMRQALPIDSNDTLAAITTSTFDISVLELLLPLCCGARVHVVSEAATTNGELLAEELRRSDATVMQGTPASWQMLLETGWQGNERLTALCGGERLPLDLAMALHARCGRVFNLYGPTETTIWSTVDAVPANPTRISIGHPIQNTRIYVVDRNRALVPEGVAGELAISGAGVAVGYHGNDALTQRAFVADPFLAGERMYLTGDLCRWLPDGRLEHLGRMDTQLKVRGYRIEAGDVENNLATATGVAKVAVTKRAGPGGDDRLVAFVVLVGGFELDPAALREHLGERLPQYMIPQHFIALDSLPLTANRKVDYRRLPELGDTKNWPAEFIVPSNHVERTVAEAWRELLGIDRVSMTDNFFELGGHSLLIAKLASRLSREINAEIAIADLFANPTPTGQAALLGCSQTGKRADIVAATERVRFPLSSVQRRLWFLEHFENSAGVHNIYTAYRIRGDVSHARLRQAFFNLAARHEILRTIFVADKGEPFQEILPEPQIDWRDELVDDSDEAIRRMQSSTGENFDLGEKPPWFVYIIKHGDEHHLMLNCHHLLVDAESLRILLDEVSADYLSDDRIADLEEETLQFGDFAAWQSRQLAAGAYEAGLDFWRTELTGELPVLRFPSFTTRPPTQTFAGNAQTLTLEKSLINDLKQLARSQGSTLNNILMAAFGAVLLRYCRQEEVVVGMPVGTVRHTVGAENSVGPYINTVALRLRPDDRWSFAQLIDYVKEKTVRAIEYGEVPFEDIVRILALPIDLSRTPVFQTMFAFREATENNWQLPGSTATAELLPVTLARNDLTCWAVENDGQVQLELEYAAELFDDDIVANFLQHLRAFLDRSSSAGNDAWSSVPLLRPEDSARMLELQNGADLPEQWSLLDQIWRAAAEHREKIAVTSSHGSMTYAKLQEETVNIAASLARQGVTRGEVVGLAVARTERLPLAILGILQAGAAYLPLDTELPAERLNYLLENSGVQCVVTDSNDNAVLADFAGRVLDLGMLDSGSSSDAVEIRSPYGLAENGLAYLMYTSGSTGLPKGVEVGHRQVANMLASFRSLTAISAGDVLAAITTTAFDISVLELLLPLSAGATVHVVSERTAVDGKLLGEEIEHCGATLMQGTPATWRLLLESDWAGNKQLQILCGGEALPLSLAQALRGLCGKLWNVYGPTETTVWSSAVAIDNEPRAITVGRPIHNTCIYVMDNNLERVPIGVEGEIVIGGDGVAFGYHGRAELTASRFMADPRRQGEKRYRTGDLGRWLPNGELEHLGRLDNQLKIRGYRIEAGDVEHHLANAPGIGDVAVTKKTGSRGDDRLVAFVVLEDGHEFEPMKLRRHLREKLPQYMIPQHFVALNELPLTPNRKVDYARLPAMDEASNARPASTPLHTANEHYIAAVWSELLGSGVLHGTDNFIELGGHSLLTIRVIAKIAKETGVEFGPQDLFSRTLGSMAKQLDVRTQGGEEKDQHSKSHLWAKLIGTLGLQKR